MSHQGKTDRIDVAVGEDTVAALTLLIEREGVTLAEALRRLVGYGDFVYRKVKQDEAEMIVKRPWRRPRALELL